MSELKMPMPKLPEIEVDEMMVADEPIEEEVEETNETSVYIEESIASVIGFVSAFGLPQPWLSKKALEYKQAAIDVGLAHNLAVLLEKYVPQLEDKPEYAVLISALAFGALVISDRMELQRKLKAVRPKRQAKVVPTQTNTVVEVVKEEEKEVKENARPEDNKNAEQ